MCLLSSPATSLLCIRCSQSIPVLWKCSLLTRGGKADQPSLIVPWPQRRNFPGSFVRRDIRYGTKQSLQVKLNKMDEMVYVIFVYQVHVSTKHRAEKKAQQWEPQTLFENLYCIEIGTILTFWHLMRNKRLTKVYAESVMPNVYII